MNKNNMCHTTYVKGSYESFKNKIVKHKTSLEDSIKRYIDNINKSLKEHCSSVNQLIDTISKDINNLRANYSKLSQFNEYTSKEKLMKKCTSFPKDQKETYEKHFEKIFNTHGEYKECLENCYSEIIPKLNEFKYYLETHLFYICQSIKFIKKCNGLKNSYYIDQILYTLENFKPYVDEFGKYVSCVGKLEKIGKKINEHISTMKSALGKVESKVDEKAKKYIEGLADIEVDAGQVQKDIRKIISMNNIIIGKLQIAKHTINFFNSLKDEISNLSGVSFSKYNIPEFLTNSKDIQQKLANFKSQIKSHLKKLETSFGEIQGHTVVMQGDTYDESYYENLVKPVESFIDVISNLIELECPIEGIIRKFIHSSLKSLKPDTRVVENKKRIKNNTSNENITIKRDRIKLKTGGVL